MAHVKGVEDLEISQDLSFQERIWRIQRIAWIIMALLVIFTILGLFGEGPLSSARAGNPGEGLWLDYPRFVRNQSQFSIQIHTSPAVIVEEKVRMEIEDEYLQKMRIERISPAPGRVISSGESHVFEFDVTGTQVSPDITLFLNPDTVGLLEAQIGVSDGMVVNFSQFVYP